MARDVGGIGPANIMKQMKGIHFPATRSEIVELVKNGPGPDTDQVIGIVEKLPEKEYKSVAEIMKEIGKIE